jgi:hypothetical protein
MVLLNAFRIIFLFFIFSGSALADTLPAVQVVTMYYAWSPFTSTYHYAATPAATCATVGTATYVYSYVAPSSCTDPKQPDTMPLLISQSSLTCPNGGTLSGSNCINVPACTAPSYRDASNACITPVACPAGQYNSSASLCSPVPDCNASAPSGGNYFDMATKTCKTTAPGNMTLCIAGGAGDPITAASPTKFCPPISDCKPAAFVCSNDSTIVSTETAGAAASIAASKAKADSAAAMSAADSSVAASIKASKDTTLTAAAAAQITAQALLASSAGSPAAQAAAQAAYLQAVQAKTQATTDQANAKAAAAVAATSAANVAAIAAQIAPPVNPGNATSLGNQAVAASNGSGVALQSAANGSGQGLTPNAPTTDVSGLTKDSTTQNTNTKLDGIGTSLTGLGGPSTKGGFAQVPSSFYTSAYPGGVSGVWSKNMATINNTSLVAAINQLSPSSLGAAGGSCPSWQFTFWKLGQQTLTLDCSIWPILRVIFMITTLFTCRYIIFGG